MRGKRAQSSLERLRQQVIVCIEKHEVLAPARADASVPGGRASGVGLPDRAN
jgi:hypothetical protein